MAVFLPIVPNWKNGIRDTYEFKTDVFVARDGSEQRRSQRVQPRRSISAAVLLDGERLRLFSDAVNRARDGKVEVADFSADAAVLTQTAASGATILHVDQVPAWLSNGVTCTLLTGRMSRKVTVDFISGTQVVLTAALTAAAGSGAQLLPMLPGSLDTSNRLSLHTTMVATGTVTLNIEPGTVVREADPLPFTDDPLTETTQVFGPAAIFYGRYVLLRKPNYLQQPQMDFNLGIETVDYARGIVKTFTPVPIVSRTLTATYLAVSHAEAMALLDVFVRAKGRAGEIYVPTWGGDLPPIVSVSGTQIVVAGTDFHATYAGDKAHKAILIRATDGTLVPREIASITTSSGNSVIACDVNVGLTASEIQQVSWMFSSRFAQDALTIEWLTNGKANLVLSFVTLVNLAAEDSFGNNWILATGYWRDGGVWQDASTWQD